jgi:hypothetical protein
MTGLSRVTGSKAEPERSYSRQRSLPPRPYVRDTPPLPERDTPPLI